MVIIYIQVVLQLSIKIGLYLILTLINDMNIIYDIPFYKQKKIYDCGVTCIKMVTEYFDKVLSLEEIKSYYNTVWNRPLYTTELWFFLK